jgi:uncharacterized membrane protein YraQ (UPF0718 family)
MKKNVKGVCLGVVSGFLLMTNAVGILGTAPALAAAPCDDANSMACEACIGAAIANGKAKDRTEGTTQCKTGGGSVQKINNVWTNVRTVINWLLIAIGLVCVIFIILGGVRFVISGGNPEKVKSGKNSIMYALIGLIIAVLSGVIVNVVFDAVGKFNP